MFLKRTLVLGLGVLLFLAAYIGFFDWRDMAMEDSFHHERLANGVEHQTLTTQITSITVPVAAPPGAAPRPGTTDAMPPSPADATPASSGDTTPTSTPAAPPPGPATPDSSPAAPSAAPDTNIIIGPMPPTPAPESTPAPSSTMVYPHGFNLARLLLAQTEQPIIVNIPAPTSPAPAPITVTPAPATNSPTAPAPAPVTSAPASSMTTNAATVEPAPLSGTGRPAPVEASVIVLLYHQFVPAGQHIPPKLQWTMNQDVFETEMKYIHDNGYHVVPMSDLLKFLRHEIGLPPNSVVITIDDGYKSAIVYAAPILKKYNFPWTFFVYPDFITVAEGKGAASWNDLLALQADGVDIESHSMTHPTLTSHHQKIKGVWHNLSPEEYDQWLTNETAGAKTLLEQKLGKPVTCFAYPYGAYNKQVEAKAIAAGYQAIFTVADNPVRSTTSMDSIGRYTITQAVIKDFYAYLRQGALGLAAMDPAPGTTITNPRPIITVVLSYAGTIDPKTIETSVRDFGDVRHDFDPQTSTLRLYLPRDLVQAVNLVNIRARDAQTGQVMVANWHFNYESPAAAAVHPPIGVIPSTISVPAPAPTNSLSTVPSTTNIAPTNSAPATVSVITTNTSTNPVDPPRATVGAH
jgi:peptidoglycan/xylan/chitin deacetylase (PgdA/CDA1 family)